MSFIAVTSHIDRLMRPVRAIEIRTVNEDSHTENRLKKR